MIKVMVLRAPYLSHNPLTSLCARRDHVCYSASHSARRFWHPSFGYKGFCFGTDDLPAIEPEIKAAHYDLHTNFESTILTAN